MSDIIIQFAVLWGINIGSPINSKEQEIANKMKAYDSEELLNILSKWAEEYLTSNIEDTVEFFEKKLRDLMDEMEMNSEFQSRNGG